ncbi:hypothetical protein ECN1_2910 [Escherichia coli N1]|nr:hypothetical protein ECN1_2910 [Escherichia coli N1]
MLFCTFIASRRISLSGQMLMIYPPAKAAFIVNTRLQNGRLQNQKNSI